MDYNYHRGQALYSQMVWAMEHASGLSRLSFWKKNSICEVLSVGHFDYFKWKNANNQRILRTTCNWGPLSMKFSWNSLNCWLLQIVFIKIDASKFSKTYLERFSQLSYFTSYEPRPTRWWRQIATSYGITSVVLFLLSGLVLKCLIRSLVGDKRSNESFDHLIHRLIILTFGHLAEVTWRRWPLSSFF